MQFFTATIALLAATVAAYVNNPPIQYPSALLTPQPTETMEINGVVMQLITDPALIFTDAVRASPPSHLP